MENSPLSKTGVYSNIVLSVILYLLTCGIYYFFWNAHQMKCLNFLLKREEFSFWLWLLLTIVTCGLFHIYYQYKMSSTLVELQVAYKLEKSENLPLISILLTLFGFSIIVDCIQQHELNKFA